MPARPPVSPRVLFAMLLGALVAAAGALFLGEYEFDEALPIVAGPLLGYVIAEIVVSIGRHRSPMMGLILAWLAGVSVLLAGWIDTNDVEPIKVGAYASAGMAALAAGIRGGPPWREDHAPPAAPMPSDPPAIADAPPTAPDAE